MKKLIVLLLTLLSLQVSAQRVLTLDRCRALALRNNKTLRASRMGQEMALNAQKAARTQYLPKVDAVGNYTYLSKEISLLSNKQKNALNNLGTNAVSNATDLLTSLVQSGSISSEQAALIGEAMSKNSAVAVATGNSFGKAITDALKTDTKNVWNGGIEVRQPIFMGGAIKAANNIADISRQMADNNVELISQQTLYDIDKAYWTAVSLRQKKNLAYSYRDLVRQLNADVHKMIKEGVATKADGLRVDVRSNEADMQIVQVEDGLVLSKMLLCQLCGLPLEEQVTLADENKKNLDATPIDTSAAPHSSVTSRPEIRLMQNAVDISEQNTNLVRAAFLPKVFLTGGYWVSNPNLYNGFKRDFSGVWNIGVSVAIPVWNWFERRYKVRASEASTVIARLNLSDMQEKVVLQVTQGRFKVKEAHKRLNMAMSNLASAEENLRCANIGFKEGVMDLTNVMEAQTAWEQAQSEKIDAEVEVKLSEVNLQKAMGNLR